MAEPTEEEIQQVLEETLEIFKKMDEYIFDPSYRIIYSLDREEIYSDEDMLV